MVRQVPELVALNVHPGSIAQNDDDEPASAQAIEVEVKQDPPEE